MSGPNGTGGSDGGGLGGGGSGLGGGGLGGGGGGEDIGVAQQADTLCCCTVPTDGSYVSCSLVGSSDCPPYTTSSPGQCTDPPPPDRGCSASGVYSGAGGTVEVAVLLLALATFRAARRRFA